MGMTGIVMLDSICSLATSMASRNWQTSGTMARIVETMWAIVQVHKFG